MCNSWSDLFKQNLIFHLLHIIFHEKLSRNPQKSIEMGYPKCGIIIIIYKHLIFVCVTELSYAPCHTPSLKCLLQQITFLQYNNYLISPANTENIPRPKHPLNC